jgi:hypothetical protein
MKQILSSLFPFLETKEPIEVRTTPHIYKTHLELRLEKLKILASNARSQHNSIKCRQAYHLIAVTQKTISEKADTKLSYLN